MSKINLTSTVNDAVLKMAEGNSGALDVLMKIIEHQGEIDPQSLLGPMSPILALDNEKIYGAAIYVLWSDKFGRDLRRLLLMLRAVQLGLFSADKLFQMSQDQRGEINLTEEEFIEVDDKVTEKLVRFQKRDPINEFF